MTNYITRSFYSFLSNSVKSGAATLESTEFEKRNLQSQIRLREKEFAFQHTISKKGIHNRTDMVVRHKSVSLELEAELRVHEARVYGFVPHVPYTVQLKMLRYLSVILFSQFGSLNL